MVLRKSVRSASWCTATAFAKRCEIQGSRRVSEVARAGRYVEFALLSLTLMLRDRKCAEERALRGSSSVPGEARTSALIC